MGLLEVLRLESSGVVDFSDFVRTDIEADSRGRKHGQEGFDLVSILSWTTSGTSQFIIFVHTDEWCEWH